jgi:hypothetical protein
MREINMGQIVIEPNPTDRPVYEMEYEPAAGPIMVENEYGHLTNTGSSEEEQSIKESLKRYQERYPECKYILRPFHVDILTFNTCTNFVVKWRKMEGFSVWEI